MVPLFGDLVPRTSGDLIELFARKTPRWCERGWEILMSCPKPISEGVELLISSDLTCSRRPTKVAVVVIVGGAPWTESHVPNVQSTKIHLD